MAITTVHNGVEILFNETEEVWEFTHNSRDRGVDSLKKAKQIIDKPITVPFDRVEAFMLRQNRRGYITVQITSVAKKGSWQNKPYEVWIVRDGNRSKVHSDDVIENTPENIARLAALDVAIGELIEKQEVRTAILGMLTHYTIPTEEA